MQKLGARTRRDPRTPALHAARRPFWRGASHPDWIRAAGDGRRKWRGEGDLKCACRENVASDRMASKFEVAGILVVSVAFLLLNAIRGVS